MAPSDVWGRVCAALPGLQRALGMPLDRRTQIELALLLADWPEERTRDSEYAALQLWEKLDRLQQAADEIIGLLDTLSENFGPTETANPEGPPAAAASRFMDSWIVGG
jgi:hypothetical protein